jgi:hypothetical protein
MVKSQNVSRTQEKAPRKCNMQIFYVLFNLFVLLYQYFFDTEASLSYSF